MSFKSELNFMGLNCYTVKESQIPSGILLTYTLDKSNTLYVNFNNKYPTKPQPNVIEIISIKDTNDLRNEPSIFYFNDNIQVMIDLSINDYESDVYLPIKDKNVTIPINTFLSTIEGELTQKVTKNNNKVVANEALLTSINDSINVLNGNIKDELGKFDKYESNDTKSVFDFLSIDKVEGVESIKVKYLYQSFNDKFRDLLIIGDDNTLDNLFVFSVAMNNSISIEPYGNNNSTSTMTTIDNITILNNQDDDLNKVDSESIDIKLNVDKSIEFIKTKITTNSGKIKIDEDVVLNEYYLNLPMIDKAKI